MDFQLLFNLAFSALLSVMGIGLGYVLNQIRSEFARIDKRIYELKKTHTVSARDSRQEHIACQQSLPNIYVTRREYEANNEAIRSDLAEIKTSIREIHEILRNRP